MLLAKLMSLTKAVAEDAGALADLEGLKSVVEPVDAIEDPGATAK